MDYQSKILIIDDEKVVIDSCIAILSSGNYEIATATDGTSGIELVHEFEPDLVFVDLKMPGISGLDVIGTIQDIDSTITTVVITGFATVGSAVEAMKRGAYDFLPKPFTPDEFRLITRRGLEKRQLLLETIALRHEKEMLSRNFTAIVSHELKSPLGAVQQNLFVLESELQDRLSEGQQTRLSKMKSRISDLLKIINTWLRVITVDLEIIKDDFQPVSVVTLLDKCIEILHTNADRKNIEIETIVDDSIAPVFGDEGTLTEVLMNLGNNAIKYSYPGGKLLFEAKGEDSNIVISVIDSGIGIPEDDLPFIFEDFYSKSLGEVKERGHGLGLALSRRIIEAHRGKISVSSIPGSGSKFSIRLPAASANSETNPQTNLKLAKVNSPE